MCHGHNVDLAICGEEVKAPDLLQGICAQSRDCGYSVAYNVRTVNPLGEKMSTVDRLAMRLKTEDKNLLIKAASLVDAPSVTQFILDTVLPAAKEIVSEAEKIELEALAYKDVLTQLSQPLSMESALQKALADYSSQEISWV